MVHIICIGVTHEATERKHDQVVTDTCMHDQMDSLGTGKIVIIFILIKVLSA